MASKRSETDWIEATRATAQKAFREGRAVDGVKEARERRAAEARKDGK